MTSSTEFPDPRESKDPSNDRELQKDSETTSTTTEDIPAFGWSAYAERVNGRFAMLGLSAVLLIEAVTGDTFFHWSGLFQ